MTIRYYEHMFKKVVISHKDFFSVLFCMLILVQ